MNKVTIKGNEYDLKGDIIKKDEHLTFKAIDLNEKTFDLSDVEGVKVISFFPDINTRICDEQTQRIAKLSSQYPMCNFISVTMDSPKVAAGWCIAHQIDNVTIVSDEKYMEFGKKTNTLITAINKLARGFMILDENNKIIDLAMNEEVASDPDYAMVETYLSSIK